jgi:hypothetical protein
MRRIHLLTAAGGFVIAALTFSLAPAQDAGKAGRNGPPAWEYRTLQFPDVIKLNEALSDPKKATEDLNTRFNELGRDGWEIATSLPGVVVFKRPKR